MVTIFDLNFKLSKLDLLQQLISGTDLQVDNPSLLNEIINNLEDKDITIKFSCSTDPYTNEMANLDILAVDDDLVIKDSGLILSHSYVNNPYESKL